MIQYWSGLPDYVFNKDCMIQNWLDANMLKGGIAYCNKITTVSISVNKIYSKILKRGSSQENVQSVARVIKSEEL